MEEKRKLLNLSLHFQVPTHMLNVSDCLGCHACWSMLSNFARRVLRHTIEHQGARPHWNESRIQI